MTIIPGDRRTKGKKHLIQLNKKKKTGLLIGFYKVNKGYSNIG